MGDRLLLYCDGSVRSGSRAGIGVVIATEDGQLLRRIGEPLPFPVTSTTECEYHALVRGLQLCLDAGAREVEVYCDSVHVVQQLLGVWQCNAPRLQELREQALQLLSRFSCWTVDRIESERNALAHTLANISSTQNRRRFFWQHPRRRRGEHTDTSHQMEVARMIVTVTAPQTVSLPDDVYSVELLDVQQQNGAYGEQFVWRLRIVDGEHAGTELRAWSNASTATNAKTIRWASSLAGKTFTQGDRIDFGALRGKRARAVVQMKPTGDGREYARVTDLLPLKPARKSEPEDEDPFLEED